MTVLFVMLAGAMASHADPITVSIEPLTFTLQGDTAILTDCTFWYDHTYPEAEIVIPESIDYEGRSYTVTEIGKKALDGITWVTSLVLPNTIKSIGDSAFHNCIQIKSFYLDKHVTHVGQGAFINCDKLTSLVVDPENPVYDSRDSCNAIIETATNKLTHGCGTSTVPYGIKTIGRQAFAYCKQLKNITLPNTVKTIEYCAFQLSGLRNIVFSDSLERIEGYAFVTNAGLSRVTLPATVTYIGEWAFALTMLDYISIGSNNVYFSAGTNCIIERSTMSIIAGSRYSYIPYDYNIKRIAPAAFAGCIYTTDLCLPRGVTEVGEYAFYKCFRAYEINIPEGVTTIGNYAFCECHDAWRLNIPSTLTEIGTGVFQDCQSLRTITIPDNIQHIGKDAFNHCANLRDLTLGTGVQVIDDNAFGRCDSINTITCKAEVPPVMASSNCFSNPDCYERATLYVPSKSVNAYKNTDYWNLFFSTLGNTPSDVDGDGTIGIADVSVMIEALLSGNTSSIVMQNADLSGNGILDIADLAALIDVILASTSTSND